MGAWQVKFLTSALANLFFAATSGKAAPLDALAAKVADPPTVLALLKTQECKRLIARDQRFCHDAVGSVEQLRTDRKRLFVLADSESQILGEEGIVT